MRGRPRRLAGGRGQGARPKIPGTGRLRGTARPGRPGRRAKRGCGAVPTAAAGAERLAAASSHPHPRPHSRVSAGPAGRAAEALSRRGIPLPPPPRSTPHPSERDFFPGPPRHSKAGKDSLFTPLTSTVRDGRDHQDQQVHVPEHGPRRRRRQCQHRVLRRPHRAHTPGGKPAPRGPPSAATAAVASTRITMLCAAAIGRHRQCSVCSVKWRGLSRKAPERRRSESGSVTQ